MTALAGRVALVTGGSRGLGLHLVEGLLAQGAQVACLARPSAELAALAARGDAKLAALPCDISDSAQVNTAVAAAVARFGRLDFLLNNAAIFQPFRLEEATDAQIEQHLGINLLGPIWAIRAAIPHLRASRGVILSISSESVRMPFPYLTVYAATKGGLEVLSAGLRDELREDGIRVVLLRAGSISGGTGSKGWDPKVTEQFYATILRTGHAAFTGDFATPESMTQAVLAVLALPEDVNVDFLEVRAAKAAQPDSLTRGQS